MPDDIIFYIRLVYFALEREKNLYFEKQNLTASQGDILLFLAGAKKRNKDVNQKDIEMHFRLTNPTVTGLLNRLEEKQFVKRVKSETDARNKLIFLTEQSELVLKQFKNHRQAIKEKIFKGINKEEQDLMLVYLKKCFTNLSEDFSTPK
ncbi:MarR family winged helix-turn-helix transcriptional regulator [Amphibacillus sediminis]|uniref:MarR family winged helix-turn-helix transcriptional regulator n=1 Tax=Amphibacillus sediminis TaxID=360185 RepID=UPI000831F6BD|nr:MarR family transcriptional regulator [Amphibacillus sediminis]